MRTEPHFAYQVEEGDIIVTSEPDDGDLTATVTDVSDEGNFLLLAVRDDDGDVTELPVGPFDTVHVVVSFEEES